MLMQRIFVYAALCLWLPATAQFSQSFTASNSNYSPISGSTLFAGDFDEEEQWIPLEFSFTFNNQAYDSVLVHTDGMVSFTSNFSQVVAPFQIDLASTSAGSISYSSSPSVLKIEYANCGVSDGDPSDAINFQLWLKSDGMIEFHYGTITILDPEDAYEHQSGALIGLLDLTGHNGGILVSGEIASPTATHISGTNKVCVNGTPSSGTVYQFQ